MTGKKMANVSSIRDTLNKHAMVVSIVVGVLLVLLITWMVRPYFHTPSETGMGYYLDLEGPDGKLVTRPITDVAPLKGAKGNLSIVQVVCYSCNNCKDKKPAYYVAYDPAIRDELQKLMQSKDPSSYQQVMMMQQTGKMISLPVNPPQWVSPQSPEGQQLMAQVFVACGESDSDRAKFSLCTPD